MSCNRHEAIGGTVLSRSLFGKIELIDGEIQQESSVEDSGKARHEI